MERSYLLVAVVAVLLGAQYTSAVTFISLLSQRADNCANELWNYRILGTTRSPARNCIQAGRVNQEPASSNLVLLPVFGTVSPQLPLSAGNIYTVTITGSGFDRLLFSSGFSFCLGLPTTDPARYCVPVPGVTTTGCDNTVLGATAPIVGTYISPTQISLPIPLGGGAGAWNQVTMEFDFAPRPICFNPAGSSAPRGPRSDLGAVPLNEFTAPPSVAFPSVFIWTGWTLGVAWNCSSVNQCNSRVTSSLPTLEQSLFSTQTVCCPTINTAWFGGQLGVCINPSLQTCCGGTPITTGVEKCCSQTQATTAFAEGACRCVNNTDCALPLENTCCVPTKYPEVTVDPLSIHQGQCYDPNRMACCNTGYRYDPATHTCCSINGLQSINTPCPCQLDTDCNSATQRCCYQQAPFQVGVANGISTCNAYANYPFGNGPAQTQGCTGVCINMAWQICCNGVPCVRNYEQCCNDTCCNKFTGSCLFARRGGAAGFTTNSLEPNALYEQCSTVEHLDTVKAYLLFALPATLLLSSLSVLALALVFANKSSARVFSLLERVLIACAVLSTFLVFPVFFSALYKYAEVVVFVSIVSIFTASVRVRWLNIFSIVVLAVAVIYIFDPFYGNAFLTLAYQRQYPGTTLFTSPTTDPLFLVHGTPDPATSGLFHSTAQLYYNSPQTLAVQTCTTFYDYFILDRNLLDSVRFDDPSIVTFGYCSRAYVIALLYFEAFVALFVLLQFVLSMLALIVRFRKQRFDPIELEVRQILLDE